MARELCNASHKRFNDPTFPLLVCFVVRISRQLPKQCFIGPPSYPRCITPQAHINYCLLILSRCCFNQTTQPPAVPPSHPTSFESCFRRTPILVILYVFSFLLQSTLDSNARLFLATRVHLNCLSLTQICSPILASVMSQMPLLME